MYSYTHSELRNSCSSLLRPILTVMLSHGVTWRDFSTVAREQYVDIARQEFGGPDKDCADRVVAAVTGLSTAVLENIDCPDIVSDVTIADVTRDASAVLSGWHRDEDFRNRFGGPLPLPEEGPVPSFRALFDRYSTSKCRRSVTDALVGAGSVERNAEGQLIARRRFHIPPANETSYLEFCTASLAEHANTLSNNLGSDTRERRFEGLVICDRAAPDTIEAFNKFVANRAERFLEEVDDWLNEFSLHPDDLSTTPHRLGLGVYAIEGNNRKGPLS